jgi:20S proteasome subunit beta 5
MNSFADRFASTKAAIQIKHAKGVVTDDEDDFDAAMWGSNAGFGSLAKGVPTFSVPAVADVSSRPYHACQQHVLITALAFGIPKASHR